jgi:hypothetical protein
MLNVIVLSVIKTFLRQLLLATLAAITAVAALSSVVAFAVGLYDSYSRSGSCLCRGRFGCCGCYC